MTGSRIADLAAKLIPCAAADIVRVTSMASCGSWLPATRC